MKTPNHEKVAKTFLFSKLVPNIVKTHFKKVFRISWLKPIFFLLKVNSYQILLNVNKFSINSFGLMENQKFYEILLYVIRVYLKEKTGHQSADSEYLFKMHFKSIQIFNELFWNIENMKIWYDFAIFNTSLLPQNDKDGTSFSVISFSPACLNSYFEN